MNSRSGKTIVISIPRWMLASVELVCLLWIFHVWNCSIIMMTITISGSCLGVSVKHACARLLYLSLSFTLFLSANCSICSMNECLYICLSPVRPKCTSLKQINVKSVTNTLRHVVCTIVLLCEPCTPIFYVRMTFDPYYCWTRFR